MAQENRESVELKDHTAMPWGSALVDLIKEVAAEVLHAPASWVQAERPLMDLGLSSAGALSLARLLGARLGTQLPATLAFDHPTINDMAWTISESGTREPVLVARPDNRNPFVTSSSCRVPGADGLDAYWRLLTEEHDAVQEVPLLRWDHDLYYSAEAPRGKTYARHGGFIEGIDLIDTNYFGLGIAEAKAMLPQQCLVLVASEEALRADCFTRGELINRPLSVFAAVSLDGFQLAVSEASVYTGPGISSAIAANRISYVFGLKGPSMAVDTACSSSLAALHAAVWSLESNRTGGMGGLVQAAIVAAADVMLGAGSLMIRSVAGMLSPDGRCKTFNATADGYIRGEGAGAVLLRHGPGVELCAVATNQDGKSATLTAPNGPSQALLLRSALGSAGLDSDEVGALECHGTGTALGDPIEVGAIHSVRSAKNALVTERVLYLGAAKSNHGHLEAAAGFAGLMKVAAALKFRQVPPNIHFKELNPHIFLGSRLAIAEHSDVNGAMGVSLFGFGGTNSHALLRAPQPKSVPRRVALLFTGMGSHLPGMGKELYHQDEAFKMALNRCARLLEGTLDLMEVLFSPEAMQRYDQSSVLSQLGVFCLEFALSEAWRARGLQPFAVLGHSLGEYTAAVVAGVLSLEDALRVLAKRGELLDKLPSDGEMVSLKASSVAVENALRELTDLPGAAVIAAINTPEQTVISGHKAAVQLLCQKLGAKSTALRIPRAMHSPLMAPILPELGDVLASCKLSLPKVQFVSCLTGNEASQELLDVQHWLGQDQAKPVLFWRGVEKLIAMGCDAFLELGPQPVLTQMGRRINPEKLWLSSLQADEADSMLHCARELGVLSCDRPQPLKPVRSLLHPLLGRQNGNCMGCDSQRMRLFRQHQVGGRVVPNASHLLLAVAAHLRLEASAAVEFANVSFEQAMMEGQVQCTAHQSYTEVGGDGSVYARFGPCERVSLGQSRIQRLRGWQEACDCQVEGVHQQLQEQGLDYGEAFQTLSNVKMGKSATEGNMFLAQLRDPPRSSWEMALQLLRPALLDGAFQLVALASAHYGQPACLPGAISRAVVSSTASEQLWAGVLVRSHSPFCSDVEIFDEQGQLVVLLEGVSSCFPRMQLFTPTSKELSVGSARMEAAGEWISAVAASIVGHAIEADAPLMASGMDSLSSTEFRNRLVDEGEGLKFPKTLMFDYPTIAAITELVRSQCSQPGEPEAVTRKVSARQSMGSTAVHGLACHLPSGWGLDECWSQWLESKDAIIQIPYARFDLHEVYDADAEAAGNVMYVRHGGFVDGAELFDCGFFGMSPAEVKCIDPQQRMALEMSYIACHHAGRSKRWLLGSNTGVFVGQCNNDWAKFSLDLIPTPYSGPGTHASISSGRISYSLGLRGTSASVDTACSSALVALHFACAELSGLGLSAALCTAVQLNLIAEPFIVPCKAHMLSPDGRCKTFNASADGYARGEGCGSAFLEKGESGPLPVVAATACNQDGRSSTLTAPNGPAQQEVIRQALGRAELLGSELGLVECHGTGTALGDPIEVGALKVMLGDRERPLQLCSVKTNIGHLEGPAGMGGFVKSMLVLQHRLAPPNIHFAKLNPVIDLDFPAEIPLTPQPVNLLASGLSSFGFGGTNAHVTCKAGEHKEVEVKQRRVAFLFTGQGSQRLGMGQELYRREESFRLALDRCDEVLKPLLDVPLLDVLWKDEHCDLLNHTKYSQPAIFSIQYALLEMWRQKGVEPCAVLGHSVGEFAAAVASQVLPLAEALRLVAARGRLIAELCEDDAGGMTACFAAEEKVLQAMAQEDSGQVSVAAVNGPQLTVVSGCRAVVKKVVEATGANHRELKVSHAFHSPLMAPMLDAFRREMSGTQFGQPKVAFISTVTGQEETEAITTPEYWVSHVLQTVRFANAMMSLASLSSDQGPEAYLEIGPEPTLVKMGRRCVNALPKDWPWLHSLESENREEESVHAALSMLSHPALRFQRQAFPWRDVALRLVKNRQSADRDFFEVALRGDLFELATSQQLHGQLVVPPGLLLEMVAEAARTLEREVLMEDVEMTWPLALAKDGDCAEHEVTIGLVVNDKHFEIHSRCVGTDKWTKHCVGCLGGPAPQTDPQPKLEGEPCALYSRLESYGLQVGPQLQICQQAVFQNQDLVCRLKLDLSSQGFVVHPFLLEATLHSAMAAAQCLMVFAGVKRIAILADAPSRDLILQVCTTHSTEQVQVCTCQVFAEGKLLWRLEDVLLRKVLPEQIQRALIASLPRSQVSFFEVKWEETLALDAFQPKPGERWLFQAPTPVLDSARELFGAPHSFGEPCKGAEGRFSHYIYIPAEEDPLAALCTGLALIQRAQGHRKKPQVWFILRGTQALHPRLMRGHPLPWHSGLWGLARCLRLEVPTSVCGCIDLGLCKDEEVMPRLRGATAAPELLLHEGRCFVPRLEDSTETFHGLGLRLASDAAYAITGGTGGLGLRFALFLAERGARHLLLMSRGGKIADPASSDAAQKIKTLASVTVVRCDVADPDSLAACLRGAQERQPVKGVLHAAGLLDDHLIMDMQPCHIAPVLKPKMDGSVNLHTALGDGLDFFVLFSSVASMLGSAGQANYCAANSFVDAFSSFRRGQGLAATALQWGPWAEVGMAARSGTTESGGFLRQDPNASLQAMALVLSTQKPVVGVARIDWASFLATQPEVPDLLDNFKHHKKEVIGEVSEDLVISTIKDALCNVLGHSDLDFTMPLMDMGLDSLSSMEFRNRLQASVRDLRVAPTVLQDFPTLRELASHVLARCDASLSPGSPCSPCSPRSEASWR
ncbi:unnamed protein product [Effrenium voratum]|nr:unnamed protein product [Effrenium voratum]